VLERARAAWWLRQHQAALRRSLYRAWITSVNLTRRGASVHNCTLQDAQELSVEFKSALLTDRGFLKGSPGYPRDIRLTIPGECGTCWPRNRSNGPPCMLTMLRQACAVNVSGMTHDAWRMFRHERMP
jgi:hypothetical protein